MEDEVELWAGLWPAAMDRYLRVTRDPPLSVTRYFQGEVRPAYGLNVTIIGRTGCRPGAMEVARETTNFLRKMRSWYVTGVAAGTHLNKAVKCSPRL